MCFVYFMLISILNFYIFYFKSFFLFKKNHLCIVYFEFSFPGLKNLTYWSTPDYEKANWFQLSTKYFDPLVPDCFERIN